MQAIREYIKIRGGIGKLMVDEKKAIVNIFEAMARPKPDFLSANDVGVLMDWVVHSKTDTAQCKKLKTIWAKFPNKDCVKKPLYRGVSLSRKDALKMFIIGSGLKTTKPCESWSVDKKRASDFAMRMSVANPFGVVLRKQPSDASKICLLNFGVLGGYDWTGLASKDMVRRFHGLTRRENESVLVARTIKRNEAIFLFMDGFSSHAPSEVEKLNNFVELLKINTASSQAAKKDIWGWDEEIPAWKISKGKIVGEAHISEYISDGPEGW